MKTWAEKIVSFYESLEELDVPTGVEIMNPYSKLKVLEVVKGFFHKYYNDSKSRFLVLGINPGRLGGGVTGISFTDPIRLEEVVGISNDFVKKAEPSSTFIYDVIEAFGGTEHFFSHFFLSSICPLGFLKEGKNYNFYDDPSLEKMVRPFIIKTMKQQIEMGASTSVAFCLGNGKNYKYLLNLNKELKLFESIVPLPHPRWIIQYNRRNYQHYIQFYMEQFEQCLIKP